MRTSDFAYDLPGELIAQQPLRPRDNSRLLVFNRQTEEIGHHHFRDLTSFLSPEDVLVLNDTKVIPARLKATKIPSGGAVEILLLKRVRQQRWEVLVGGRRVRRGTRLQIEGGPQATIIGELGKSKRLLAFNRPISLDLERIGEMPLPPYISTPIEEPNQYQTIFAREPGSAAAPTAGFHFTGRLLEEIQKTGVQIAWVTLHVGLDTFAPVTEELPADHTIHREWCRLDEQTARLINRAEGSGGRVIAVGTTSVRTLESAAQGQSAVQLVRPFEGYTSLYILPGYTFKAVDAIITNFHLPRSTLLMMISAFTGRKKLLQIYEQAIELQYRFYSFGDAMLIL